MKKLFLLLTLMLFRCNSLLSVIILENCISKKLNIVFYNNRLGTGIFKGEKMKFGNYTQLSLNPLENSYDFEQNGTLRDENLLSLEFEINFSDPHKGIESESNKVICIKREDLGSCEKNILLSIKEDKNNDLYIGITNIGKIEVEYLKNRLERTELRNRIFEKLWEIKSSFYNNNSIVDGLKDKLIELSTQVISEKMYSIADIKYMIRELNSKLSKERTARYYQYHYPVSLESYYKKF